MKRLICALLVVLLLAMAVPAPAEVVGGSASGLIHRYSAPDGQDIYFISWMDNEAVSVQDVNFDGVNDLVALTIDGASNAGYEFFVCDQGKYVWASRNTEEDALYNYSLDATRGLVISRGKSGLAGALHEICVYRWVGTDLQLVRSAVGDYAQTVSAQGDLNTQTTDYATLSFTVLDAEQNVLWNTEVPILDDKAIESAMGQEETRLFEGL